MSPDAKTTASLARAPSMLGHLLNAAAQADRPYREALFLTFNIDVGFFETRLLGMCRAAGAAVTVAADAHVFAFDPRSARAAGQSYALGLAAVPGAFHPKLSILAGPDHALINIGSGNITVNGWHRSDEIALLIDADDASCPVLVNDIADWLAVLPSVVRLGATASHGIRRTVAELRHLTERSNLTETGHTLVSSTRGPILKQLPAEKVRRLKLYAPFHDADGRTLGEMCHKWNPDAIHVAVQPGVTVINPDSLLRVVAATSTELIFQSCDVSPYRHGKLIEAECEDGSTWSLTGSPNLTAAALLGQLPHSGNCELGVITYGTPPVYPGIGGELTTQSIPTVHLLRPEDAAQQSASRSTPVLIAATLLIGGLVRLEFARPLPLEAIVQISDFDDLPERYRDLGVAPAGALTHDLPANGSRAGSRVRLVWARGTGRDWGSDLPLVDPEKVTQRIRPAHSGRSNTNADPLDLFQDPQLAHAWSAKMLELVSIAPKNVRVTAAAGGQRAGDPTTQAEDHRTLEDSDSWLRYTDDARARLGSLMVDFALGGLPRIGADDHGAPATPIWVDRLGEDDEQFDDERTAEDQDAAAAKPNEQERTRALHAHERARYRRWLTTLTDPQSEPELIDRLARAGLVLLGTRMQIWEGERGPHGWFDILAAAVAMLPAENVPQPLRQQMADFTAVALYRLDRALPTDLRSTEAKLLRTLIAERTQLLHHACPSGVDANTQTLRVGLEPPSDGEAVWDYLTCLLSGNPVESVQRDLERAFPDYEITHLHDEVFAVQGGFPNPVRAAADVLEQLDAPPVAAVVATNGTVTATLVRNGNRLTVVRDGQGPRTYASFVIGPLTSITSLASGGETAQRHRLRRGPLQQCSPEAGQDLRAAGLE